MARLEELEIGALSAESAARRSERLGVEVLSPESAAVHAREWRHLAADCLEPNVFMEPGFALAAARHLAVDRPPRFLFVRDDRRLVAVCPLQFPPRLVVWSQLRVWTHEQAPLGVPLLDRRRAKEALGAIIDYCGDYLPHTAGLMFPQLPRNGPTARLLETSAQNLHLFDVRHRAVLRAGTDLHHSMSSSRRKKIRRARAALEALGAVSFRLMREPGELRAAAEEFLALEAKGWKGRRGTALLQSVERAAFARRMMSTFTDEGKLSIARLGCGSLPVGMGVVLESGGHAFYWKLAYDEDFAAYSPGVLVSFELSQALLRDTRILLTDSCAAEGRMIEHLWKERMGIADFLVALGPDRRRGFYAARIGESAYRNLRGLIKDLIPRRRRVPARRLAPKP